MYSICVNDKYLPLLDRMCVRVRACVSLQCSLSIFFFGSAALSYIPVVLFAFFINYQTLGRRVEEAQDDLVHGKHHCRAGNRAHEVRCQAAVETHEAFFLPDELEALYQASVLELAVSHGSLSKTGSRNLSRI